MIYVSPSIVLSAPLYASLIYPAFLWQNRVTAVEGDEAAIYPASNLLNPQTSSLWKSDAAGTATLVLSIANDEETDALGIARHNFAGRTVTVEGITADEGADWALLAELSPADNSPIVAIFDAGNYVELRLVIEAGGDVAQAAVIYAGTLLRMVTGVPPGHQPINDALDTTMLTGIADNGDFLGDIITSQRLTTRIDFRMIDGGWYRENLRPFALSRVPFFWAWAPAIYPDEAAFSKFLSSPKPTISQATGEMDLSFDVVGLAL